MESTQPTSTEPSPAPLRPSAVVSEPATVQACADDYKTRSSSRPEHPSGLEAAPHTYGHH